MKSFKKGYRAVIAGSTGGIGRAFLQILHNDTNCGEVIGLSRSTTPHIDLLDEQTIADAAQQIGGEVHLFVDATGFLSDHQAGPEKSLRAITPENMARLFAINATGPALLMKHFIPLLPREERGIFATLSARVGSIGDNRLGGWHSYRASKAALNMLVRGAAIEASRTRKHAVLTALHPGTVKTPLSEPFAADRPRLSPEEAAARLLAVIDALKPKQSGSFHAYDGTEIPW